MTFRMPEKQQVSLNGLSTDVEEAAANLGFATPTDYLIALHELYQTGQIHVPAQSTSQTLSGELPRVALERSGGTLFHGDSAILMEEQLARGSVDLIMTSPPFGLIKKKAYGNEDADEYVNWFEQFARGFKRVLKETGSLVIDIGGAWKKGQPTRSLYHYDLLVRLCRGYGFHLAQEFYWWNPAKLPLPAEWVNVRRIRVRDSVNCIWWLSKTPFPKASNRRVLQPYSKSMKALHKRGDYNTKVRSGGHKPGATSFLKDHGGSIPHNLIAIANTGSNSAYHKYCRDREIDVHPAQFPSAVPAFFIRMLTDQGDTVFDPFAGSCVTGEVAEQMGRNWICCELEVEYVQGAIGRFHDDAEVHNYEPSRTKPYDAHPPHLSILTEADTPLPTDGGRERPKTE